MSLWNIGFRGAACLVKGFGQVTHAFDRMKYSGATFEDERDVKYSAGERRQPTRWLESAPVSAKSTREKTDKFLNYVQ